MTEDQALLELKRIGEQYKHDAETAHEIAEAGRETMNGEPLFSQECEGEHKAVLMPRSTLLSAHLDEAEIHRFAWCSKVGETMTIYLKRVS